MCVPVMWTTRPKDRRSGVCPDAARNSWCLSLEHPTWRGPAHCCLQGFQAGGDGWSIAGLRPGSWRHPESTQGHRRGHRSGRIPPTFRGTPSSVQVSGLSCNSPDDKKHGDWGTVRSVTASPAGILHSVGRSRRRCPAMAEARLHLAPGRTLDRGWHEHGVAAGAGDLRSSGAVGRDVAARRASPL